MSIKIFNQNLQMAILLLGLADLFVLVFSVYASYPLMPDYQPGTPLWQPAVTFTLLNFLSLLAVGLYRSNQRFLLAGALVRVLTGITAGTIAVLVVASLRPGWAPAPGHLMTAALAAVFGTSFARMIFYRIVDEDYFKRDVLIYGAGVRASSLMQLRRRSDRRGFSIKGFVHAEGDRDSVDQAQILHVVGPLLKFARENAIDEIVVAMDDRRRAFPVHDLLECKLAGIEVIELVNFLERESGRVALDVLNPTWLIFSDGFKRSAWRRFNSRAFDLLASIALLLLIWPFMLLAAIAIMIEDGPGKPIIYRQKRVGLEGKSFELLKFRSMAVDAEKDGARWADHDDERITRVGRVIRALRIDECPQLVNVFRGDMAVVGPRPERPEFVHRLNQQIPYYRERHCVKPGITGWAQLCYPYGSSDKDVLEKLQYDMFYVKNHNLLFDLLIVLQTVEVIVWRKGSR